MGTTGGLSSLFGPSMGLKYVLPDLSGGVNGPNPPNPAPQRTQYTGGLGQTIPDAYHQAGNNNNQYGQTATVAPHADTSSYTLSELGAYPTYTGYNYGAGAPITQPGTVRPAETNFGPQRSVTQLNPFHQTGFANLTNKLAAEAPPPVQHPTEPTHQYSTEGEWGGGIAGGSGSPQQFGPTWMQSYNGGATWSPQYGTQATPGQAPSGNWTQLNGGGSAPQWIQRK